MADDEYTMHFASRLYEQLQPPLPGGAGQAKAIIQVFLNELIDAERLSSKPQATVQGYTPQPDAKVSLVNTFKVDEERLLRKLDAMQTECFEDAKRWLDAQPKGDYMNIDWNNPKPPYDENLLRQARETFAIGFMLLNRAVFQPTRIKLPEDEK